MSAAVRLRRATLDDVPFLVELATHADVEPFLSARRPRDVEFIGDEVERSRSVPGELGRFVIEVEDAGGWRRAGAVGFDTSSVPNRIARLGGLAVHPRWRGKGLADQAARLFQRHLLLELGFHRLELECYAFNTRAVRHAERAGFVREGVRRRAYERHGEWVDGVLFGLTQEDLAGAAEKP